ncbi:MAG: hypothetical protein AB1896_12085 [Thermodesulfobacteriota bacterium]
MAGARITRKQKETLKELDKLARRLGLRVSYGQLRFGGLRLKGGQCLFRGERWVVLDRGQPYEDQLDVFREALGGLDLQTEEVPPGLRVLLALGPPAATAGPPQE